VGVAGQLVCALFALVVDVRDVGQPMIADDLEARRLPVRLSERADRFWIRRAECELLDTEPLECRQDRLRGGDGRRAGQRRDTIA
jgi:hypothetical protein